MTRRFWIGLILVLVLAAIMRVAYPGVVEFKHDEAMLSLLAQDFSNGGDFPLTGIPSSVGVPNPPVSVWIMAIPYAITDDPLFATMFVAALNVIGVGLLYTLAYRYIGFWPAVIAGIAYAVNPWAVLYSRKIWAQDFQTPFIILALLVGLIGFYEGKRWAKILCLPLLLFALQIHFATWALLPLWAYLFLTQRSKEAKKQREEIEPPSRQKTVGTAYMPSAASNDGTRTRYIVSLQGVITLVISLTLAALVMLPFAIGLSRTLEQDPNRLSNAVDRNEPIIFSSKAANYAINFLTGVSAETEIAPEIRVYFNRNLTGSSHVFFLVTALVGSTLMLRHSPRMAGFLVLWVLLPVTIFTPTWTEIYPHYFITIIPALCLLMGSVAVSWSPQYLIETLRLNTLPKSQLARLAHPQSLKRGIQLWVLFVILCFGGFILTQAAWWFMAMRTVDANTTGKFGTPLHYLLNVRDALRDEQDVIVLTDGMEILYDQEPAIWSVMLDDSARCVRALTGDGRLVMPAQPFAVLVAPNAPDNPIGGVYANDTLQTFDLRPGEGSYALYEWDTAPTPSGQPITPLEPMAAFDSGAFLAGYALDTEAKKVTLTWNLWNPPDGSEPKDYQYFVHFLDSAGEKIGQRDDRFWPGRYWCGNDVLYTWGNFELTADRPVATLRVGMYTLETNGGFINTTLDGGATWVDIPVLSTEG